MGKSSQDIHLWRNPSDRQGVINELREKGSCANLEAPFVRKDGREIWGLLSAKVIELQTGPHIISVTHDITRRRQAEAEKAELETRNQQLQKSESLGRMAGAIAHHFNNKLQVVTGNLEMALGAGGPEPATTESLAAALQSAREAAEVSGLLLTYLGRSSSEQERVALSEFCRKSLPLLRVTAALPDDMVLESVFEAPGPVVKGNVNQLQQLLTQLVTNACEACKANQGCVRVAVKTVTPAEITLQHTYPVEWRPLAQSYACLEVVDTGCGIAEQNLKMIFDPFYSTKFIGRGLGLSVVLGLVRIHEGAITVTSAPGRGSAFRVYFPVIAQLATHPPAELHSAVTAGPAQGVVLLVEDEADVRILAEKMLARLGYTVLAAQDGVEALDLFRKHRQDIQCVLSDLTMPRLNGWDTLTALRQLRPELPVVLVSGYDEASVMAGEHPEQPQAFVSKPYTLKALREAIAIALAAPASARDARREDTAERGEESRKT
jgi:signal transduction histidine kinase/CheY-like chemotaxis protein